MTRAATPTTRRRRSRDITMAVAPRGRFRTESDSSSPDGEATDIGKGPGPAGGNSGRAAAIFCPRKASSKVDCRHLCSGALNDGGAFMSSYDTLATAWVNSFSGSWRPLDLLLIAITTVGA